MVQLQVDASASLTAVSGPLTITPMNQMTIPTVDQFRYTHEIEVRFRDLDGMGHVNNSVFATYFETGRIRYMSELGKLIGKKAETPSGQSFILLDLYCRYVDQVSYGEWMLVHLRVAKIGGKSFQIEYLITSRDDGRTVAYGQTTQVGFDYATGKTIVMSDEFRRAVADFDGE
jgi:acyl-CoA thioester hydrolase